MQRANYGQSPPLHHPVPQHVSTVPQLRSPPPPPGSAQSQQGYGGNPYQQQGGGTGNVFGAYGQFMNDPTAQVAAQFGQTALKHGQEYVEQNIGRYVNVSALKHYFNVSNSYVINKLFLVLFPWRHKPWARKQATATNGQEGWYLPPREDINSPDMYIPVMAIVTFILLSTLIAGLRGDFQPELLGYTATKGLVVVIVEIIALKLGCYLLSISSQSQLFDLIAYSGYKFVGIIATIAVAEIVNGGKGTGGWIGWTVFLYTFLANSLFLMRSLKYVLLPENAGSNAMPSPIVEATIQSAGLGVLSSILAQCITAYRQAASLSIDWIPVFQYLLFIIVSTPPNFLWQEFIEATFPSHPEPAATPAQKKSGQPAEQPPLSTRNTAIKFLLDQTVGAAVNTLLYSTFTRSLRMASGHAPRVTSVAKAVRYWVSPDAVYFGRVDLDAVWAEARAEFCPLILAGYRLWPAVSLINFTLVKSVQGRNLLGALAGVVWGVYICLFSSN
ncbi:Hrf1 [Cordyceps fumosorosea ARSEF 2679]|uniref:Hrf1 n=1 Tax=Cordyceps fumosorosea (strain ARSEF 2679) TaxID=1081104 RepID=A0A168D411_CORFA|nr:Hrf1 [Cordyceps fumosorosea ARSEF 2679]OAA72146.1 Hrf1 [Cordyceps fumosorosea ARSEF 2679]